jgi:phage gpG-like protein
VNLESLVSVVIDAAESAADADYTEALDDAIEILQGFERRLYLEQRDAGGRAWAPLAMSTILRKEHGAILVDSGRMYESLTTPNGTADTIWETGDTWLRFGTSVPYAHWHQTGTRRMPARPHVGCDQPTADTIARVLGNAVAEHIGEQIHG